MIHVEELYKRYGDQQVLNGVTFDIRTGSVTTLMGLSGSGKSVLMRHMIGLEKPDRGAILVNGEDIVGMKPKQLNKIRRRFGVSFKRVHCSILFLSEKTLPSLYGNTEIFPKPRFRTSF